MYKYVLFFLIFFLSYTLEANTKNIDKKISINKNILKSKTKEKQKTKLKIQNLADAIISEETIANDLEYNLERLSNNIFLNKLKLQKAKNDILRLSKETANLKKYTSDIENKIVNSIINKYSITLGEGLIDKYSLKGIIQKEKYSLLLDNTKDTILKSNLQYFKLSNDKRKNDIKKNKLEIYIQQQKLEKNKFKKLKIKQERSVNKLKIKHKKYQKELKFIISKQDTLNNLLGKLNILKKKKIRKDKLAKIKERKRLARIKANKIKEEKALLTKQKASNKKIKMSKKIISSKDIKFSSKKNLEKDIDLKVRNIGSTSKGIKISSYNGRKTISPLKNYTITKKFGKFYDPVYKIELFNESISMKSKNKNAKVYSVLKGKVVYAKHDAGELGNVVIVKHNHNLHTIYSQLSNIPKTLKVGQWIKKGYVVGRVTDTLVFQATRNNKYLNPQKLFK